MTTTAWRPASVPADEPGALLAETADRLQRVVPDYPDAYAVRLTAAPADGWTTLDAAVPLLVTQAAAAVPGAAAPARVAGALSYAVAGRMTAALVIDDRSPVLDRAATIVRCDGAGSVGRVAVTAPAIALLAGDPAAGHPDAVTLPDRAALLRWAAGTIIGTLTPLFADLRAATRFGLGPMWNMAGDAVLSVATWLPFLDGRDQRPGRALGEELLDALIAQGAPVRRRGSTLCLTRSRSTFVAPVDAACCMHYRTQPEVERKDAYCVSCPHLSGADRRVRYTAYLAEYHPERGH